MAAVAVLIVACERAGPAQAPPLAPPSTSAATGGACADPITAGVSTVRFTFEGSCLDVDVLVLYRCSATAVPVLRVASEDGSASFLGGPFAVTVETVPASVRFVGAGEGWEVLIADPVATPTPHPTATAPLVYVRHDNVTERWLRLPSRRTVSQPPTAWLIGDSILHGGRRAVARSLSEWSLTIDAEDGRPSSQGIAPATEAARQHADVVLVELGTNDSTARAFRDHLVQTLDLLGEVPLVLWQTARAPEELTTIASVNDVIRQIVPRYPNTAIADWEAYVPADRLMDDGIHPEEGSERLEAQLLAPILTAWRDAVSGAGATSCERRVLGAAA